MLQKLNTETTETLVKVKAETVKQLLLAKEKEKAQSLAKIEKRMYTQGRQEVGVCCNPVQVVRRTGGDWTCTGCGNKETSGYITGKDTGAGQDKPVFDWCDVVKQVKQLNPQAAGKTQTQVEIAVVKSAFDQCDVAKQVHQLNPGSVGKAQTQVEIAVTSDRGTVVPNVTLPTSRLPKHEKS